MKPWNWDSVHVKLDWKKWTSCRHPPPANQLPYCFTVRTGLGVNEQILFFKIQWMHFFLFYSTGKVDMVAIQMLFQALYTLNSPKQIKEKNKQNKNQLSNLSKWWMCTFITLLKTLTVLWALSEQLPIVHVSTDPWRGCDRFYNLNFLAFQKESQVKSRNDIIYTGFHMQLRSWRLKLQPKIMSYQH